jgi:hypothetical protein
MAIGQQNELHTRVEITPFSGFAAKEKDQYDGV